MPSLTTTYTSDPTLDRSLDHLIDQSWSKCFGKIDKIDMAQLFNLINDVQKVLKIESLFTSTELKNINHFKNQSSHLKFTKSDAKRFILSVTGAESFASLLKDRFGLSNEVVRERIYDSKSSSNDAFRFWRNSQNKIELRARSIKDEEIDNLRKEIAIMRQTNNEKDIQLKISEQEIDRLKTRLADLTTLYKNGGDNRASLVTQLADRDAALIELTQLCKQYKDTCI